jgi:hypothetical protein
MSGVLESFRFGTRRKYCSLFSVLAGARTSLLAGVSHYGVSAFPTGAVCTNKPVLGR